MAAHCAAMVGFLDAGSEVFDYGNSLRAEAQLGGFERAFDYPGFLPAYIRPLFCEGKGPFRWVALSGDPADIAATDRAVLEEFPDDEALARWIRLAGERVAFQGLPARICWLGYGERHRLGLRFNEMVRDGEVSAPIVIGRDHLDSGSVASPYRETEAMADGSDAIADWPLLNALVNTAAGATWVSDPPRRRRRHRPLDPRRDGLRRRRHRPRRREARAGAHHRPRHGRDPPRRRRLRARRSRSPPSAASASRCEDGAEDRGERPRDRHDRRSGAARAGPRGREPTSCAPPPSRQLIDDLIETKRAADGAGIAAQPGRRVAADRARRGRGREPALSLQAADPADRDRQPGHRADRRRDWSRSTRAASRSPACAARSRATSASASATSTARRPSDELVASGMTAGTFQHEVDHLDGVLFCDRSPTRGRFSTWEQFERRHRDGVRPPDGGADRTTRSRGRGMSHYWCELAWLGGERAEPGVLVETEGERISSVEAGVASPPAGAERLAGLTLPGLRQRPLPRLPAGASRPRTGARRRLVLGLARAHVRARRANRPRQLPRPRPGLLRRDGAGRDHHRRRVPLPPPPPGRRPLRGPERDSASP